MPGLAFLLAGGSVGAARRFTNLITQSARPLFGFGQVMEETIRSARIARKLMHKDLLCDVDD
jgi:hypothetical protein